MRRKKTKVSKSCEDGNKDLEEESQPVQEGLPDLQSPGRVDLRLSQLSHGKGDEKRTECSEEKVRYGYGYG